MGRPKALLPAPDGRPFVASIVRALALAGIGDIVIVTGRDHESIVDAVAADEPPVVPRFARNPDPSRGQVSSLWAGMDVALEMPAEALAVTLVDVPLVTPRVIRQVLDAWTRTRAPIVRPARGERHGHPVVFDRSVFAELRAAPLEAGAKAVVQAHAHDLLDVAVDDDGALIDVDTPADYEAVRRMT